MAKVKLQHNPLVVPSQAADFHGATGAKSNAGPIFGDVDNEAETFEAPVVAARMPVLFRVIKPSVIDRTVSSQRHDCANRALGIRKTPMVMERFDYSIMRLDGKQVLSVESYDQKITVVGHRERREKHNGDSQTSLHAVSLSLETGTFTHQFVSEVEVPLVFAYKPNQLTVVTEDGVVLVRRSQLPGSERFRTVYSLARVVADDKKPKWSFPLVHDESRDGETYFASVSWLHRLPKGDIVVLYGQNSPAFKSTSYTRLSRLDPNSGAPVYTVDCPWTAPAGVPGYLNRANGDTEPQILDYDEKNEIAIIGVRPKGDAGDAKIYSIALANGTCQELATLPFDMHQHVLIPLSNGRMVSVTWPDIHAPAQAELLCFQNGKMSKTPFELPDGMVSDIDPVISNMNQEFAVRTTQNEISFYEVTSGGFKLIKSQQLPEGQDRHIYHYDIDPTVMTSDHVVYVSRVLKKFPMQCRLYAFDAETGNELWTFDETFSAKPTLVLNEEGTLAWLDAQHAVILGQSDASSLV